MSETPHQPRGLGKLPGYAAYMLQLLGLWLRPLLHLLLRWMCIRVAPLLRWIRPPRPTAGPPGRPLRVLHVTCSFDVGGSQRQIQALCERSGGGSWEHRAIEVFPEQNFIYRRGVPLSEADYSGRSRVVRWAGRLVMNINSRSQQIVQIYKFYRDFRRLRPDLVVGWGHEIAMLAFAAAALARVPRIVSCIRTVNPISYRMPLAPLFLAAHRRMAAWTDAIVVNSTFLQRDHAGWLGICPALIRVCPNGIDLFPADPAADGRSRRDIRRNLGIPEHALVILNAGRFAPEKGQALLVRALERVVKDSGPADLHAVLCGDGPLLSEVQAQAARACLTRIHFPGRLLDIRPYLAAADIFVMPSDFEGMPNAMMEAMTCGLPCVSTNRSGAMDIARDRQEALYVEPGDDRALGDRLLELIRSPEERRRLGGNAKLRMAEFTVDKMIGRFEAVLALAVERKN